MSVARIVFCEEPHCLSSFIGTVAEERRRPRLIDNPKEFLLARISKDDGGCWNWTGYVHHRSYALISVERGRRKIAAHRLSYEVFIGQVRSGMFVCHRCDNKRCINPEHLFLGTHADNMRDMSRKGRARGAVRPGESNGSARLGESQVREIRAIYSLGGVTQPGLAARFGVSRSNISAIVRRETWRSVAS